MRPIGVPAPRYLQPVPEAEKPVMRSTLKKHPDTSQASEQFPATPSLGSTHRYRGGHYGYLAEAIIHMKIADQESSNDKSQERRSEHRVESANRNTVADSQNVASTSRQTAGGAVESFMASDLSELASWSEKTSTYFAEPVLALGRNAKIPRAAADKMLNDAKKYMESSLQWYGLRLDDVLTKRNDKRLEINLNYLEMRSYVVHEGAWVRAHDDRIIGKLIGKANAYMEHFLAQGKPALAPMAPLKSRNSIGVMRELLQDAPGLVIGEAHNSKSSKRVFIDNIKALKSAGVTTLYLEHVCADSHGKALSDYMAAPKGSLLPVRLHAYLDLLTRGNLPPGEKMPKHSFAELVKAAKDGGLNIIPLDTAETYATSGSIDNTRIKVLNHYAAEKIRLSKPEGKWIAFVGSAHATTYEGVPGLAQLQGVRSLIVDDFGNRSRPEVKVNVKNYAGKLNPDVTISYKI